jgi:hypothetical protein
MNHSYHLFLVAAVLLLLLWWMRPVSATSYDAMELTNQLYKAVTQWEVQNITHYQFPTWHERSGLTKSRQPLKVELDSAGMRKSYGLEHAARVFHERKVAVVGDAVATSESASTVIQGSLPVSEIVVAKIMVPINIDLYDHVDEASSDCAYQVDAVFDAYFGYPSLIYIDQHAGTTMDRFLWGTAKLLSIDGKSAASGGAKQKRDFASMELFPTVVTFVLLTWILF